MNKKLNDTKKSQCAIFHQIENILERKYYVISGQMEKGCRTELHLYNLINVSYYLNLQPFNFLQFPNNPIYVIRCFETFITKNIIEFSWL